MNKHFDKHDQASAASPARYLTERELANRLHLSVRTLQKKRIEGGFIPFARFGTAVRYPLEAVAEYERAAMCLSTSDYAEGSPSCRA